MLVITTFRYLDSETASYSHFHYSPILTYALCYKKLNHLLLSQFNYYKKQFIAYVSGYGVVRRNCRYYLAVWKYCRIYRLAQDYWRMSPYLQDALENPFMTTLKDLSVLQKLTEFISANNLIYIQTLCKNYLVSLN